MAAKAQWYSGEGEELLEGLKLWSQDMWRANRKEIKVHTNYIKMLSKWAASTGSAAAMGESSGSDRPFRASLSNISPLFISADSQSNPQISYNIINQIHQITINHLDEAAALWPGGASQNSLTMAIEGSTRVTLPCKCGASIFTDTVTQPVRSQIWHNLTKTNGCQRTAAPFKQCGRGSASIQFLWMNWAVVPTKTCGFMSVCRRSSFGKQVN